MLQFSMEKYLALYFKVHIGTSPPRLVRLLRTRRKMNTR